MITKRVKKPFCTPIQVTTLRSLVSYYNKASEEAKFEQTINIDYFCLREVVELVNKIDEIKEVLE